MGIDGVADNQVELHVMLTWINLFNIFFLFLKIGPEEKSTGAAGSLAGL